MLVLNGVSHPRSTNRSYLLRSTLPAVYFRPPPATIRRSSLMSSSCTIITFLESPGSTRRRSVHQPHGESNRKRAKAPRKGMDFFNRPARSPKRGGPHEAPAPIDQKAQSAAAGVSCKAAETVVFPQPGGARVLYWCRRGSGSRSRLTRGASHAQQESGGSKCRC